MRKALAAVALALAVAAPAAAQGEFFGMTPEDAQAAIGRAMADQKIYEAQLAQKRAQKAKGPGPVDRVLGTYATPQSDFACVYEAVARHLGQETPGKAPAVYLESRTILEDFQQWVYQEDGKTFPSSFYTVYLPQASVLFLDDHASLYSARRTIDDAAAGQLGVAALIKQGASAETAKGQAGAIESWFHENAGKAGLAGCQPR